MSVGITRADMMDMPWGQLVLMLQAKAQTYETEPEDTPAEDVFRFFASRG